MKGHLALALVCTAILAGCGGTSSAPPRPKTVGTRTYHDAKYGFSFRYDRGWKVARHGTGSAAGSSMYTLPITPRDNSVGVKITVDSNLESYADIPEGKVAPYGGDTLHYHHLTVSGWPSLQISRYSGSQLDGIFTITNTHTYSYEVAMITGEPPFSASARAGYSTIVNSLKLPF